MRLRFQRSVQSQSRLRSRRSRPRVQWSRPPPAGAGRVQTAPLVTPIPAGRSDANDISESAGTITSASATGSRTPSDSTTAATATSSAAIAQASQPSRYAAARGERLSPRKTSTTCESRLSPPLLCRAQMQSATTAHAAPPTAIHIHAGSTPAATPATTSEARSVARKAPIAAGIPPATQSRLLPVKTREKSAIRAAPPRCPGSSELTSEPKPYRAPASSRPIRPPHMCRAQRQAHAEQTTPAANENPANRSQIE